ncbi:MAG TPA: DUF488 domain-containing protein [Anaerolineales bacterium]|jgi:uncharacterized protein (DUF488 family)|nr:DUF488 domain-containing protein [Anaerolineales bacterium]
MSKKEDKSEVVLYTIGHSNRDIDEFIGLLKKNKIEALIDVRKLPGSKKYPHFNQEELSLSLGAAGIRYIYIQELGGRRKPNTDSVNTLWRNRSFQAYADYMGTAEFRIGIGLLLGYAKKKRAVIMCAEALWWRCHRALIADYLKSKGIDVYHIMSATSNQQHPFTSAARIRDGQLFYHE